MEEYNTEQEGYRERSKDRIIKQLHYGMWHYGSSGVAQFHFLSYYRPTQLAMGQCVLSLSSCPLLLVEVHACYDDKLGYSFCIAGRSVTDEKLESILESDDPHVFTHDVRYER